MSNLTQMLEMFLSRTGANTVKGTILPDGNKLYDLGSPAKKFRKFYVDELVGTSIIGTHNHQADVGGGVLDHGLALTGLADDDHTQYFNATRHTADPHAMLTPAIPLSAATATAHYTGFPDRTSTALGWNDGTYTLTLTATADTIWISGVPYTINTLTKALSVAQEAVSGLYWFWITAPGGVPQLNASVSEPGFDKCLVATVYWNTTTNKGLLGEERHWMGRDQWMHEYLHETIGARYALGLTGTFANTTFAITAGEFYDEDIEHKLSSDTPMAYPGANITTCAVLYHNGDADWAWDAAQTTPYKITTGNLRFNTGNTLSTAGANKYVNYFVFAANATVSSPIYVLIGTAEYNNLADSQAAAVPSLAALPSAEMKLLYRITYKNDGTPTYQVATDYRSSSNMPVDHFIANDHGALAGLADDDHALYWNDTRGDAKIVTHAALTTGVHGAGVSTLATVANIATHAAVVTSVHGLVNAGPYTFTIPATGTAALLGTANVFTAIQQVNSRLGIGAVPDTQFALDVVGSTRTSEYFVGKHAIQLPDALMICHFDGAMPYETDYTGNPTGHRGQVATVSGGVIYRPGKFGKGVQVAEATTNLVLNPVGGAAGNWAAAGAATVTLGSTTKFWIHSTSVKLVTTAAANDGAVATLSACANAVHYVTLRIDAAWATQQWSLDNTNWNAPALLATGADGWCTYGYAFTAAQANASTSLRIRQTDATVRTVYIGHAQAEQKAYPTPPCHGALGAGHTWSGTVHGSTSARTTASLTYPVLGNILGDVGTISFWMQRIGNMGAVGTRGFMGMGSGGTHWTIDNAGTSNSIRFYTPGGNMTGTLAHDEAWHMITVTWSAGAGILYIDGVSAASGAVSSAFTPVLLHVGERHDSYPANGFIDDFVVLSRAASAAEIRAIYESNAPVFAETSSWSWRTPATNVWADAQGFWVNDAAGLPAFGVASTANTWGGFSMDPGDVVLGNNVDGSGAMWWDASAKKLIFRGAGSATDQVYIDTDGSLKAGAGAVKLDATGITIITGTAALTATNIKYLATDLTSVSTVFSAYNPAVPDASIGVIVDRAASNNSLYLSSRCATGYAAASRLEAEYNVGAKTTTLALTASSATQTVETFINGASIVLVASTGITCTGTITGTQLISNIATGTKPLDVTSTTVCTNLNADTCDAQHLGVANNVVFHGVAVGHGAASDHNLLVDGAATVGAINYAADAQVNDTYVITLAPALAAYSTGMHIVFKAATANTGAATLNVNGLGAKTIVKAVSTALSNNDILAAMFCLVVYDGTNFVLMNPRAL